MDEFLETFQMAVDPPPPAPQKVPIFGNHVYAFHTIWPPYLLAYIWPHPLLKICNIIFRKWGGRGLKAVWNFSEHSSNLWQPSFPQVDHGAGGRSAPSALTMSKCEKFDAFCLNTAKISQDTCCVLCLCPCSHYKCHRYGQLYAKSVKNKCL